MNYFSFGFKAESDNLRNCAALCREASQNFLKSSSWWRGSSPHWQSPVYWQSGNPFQTIVNGTFTRLRSLIAHSCREGKRRADLERAEAYCALLLGACWTDLIKGRRFIFLFDKGIKSSISDLFLLRIGRLQDLMNWCNAVARMNCCNHSREWYVL